MGYDLDLSVKNSCVRDFLISLNIGGWSFSPLETLYGIGLMTISFNREAMIIRVTKKEEIWNDPDLLVQNRVSTHAHA